MELVQIVLKKSLNAGLLFLFSLMFLSLSYAQTEPGKGMPQREGMMMNEACTCPMMGGMMDGMGMHGAAGTTLWILTVLLILALIAALIAATVFLVRKSQR